MSSFSDLLYSPELLLPVAAFCLLVSLLLAWFGAFILYGKVARLKAWFPATHQLIRAHIDYLLMSLLLIASHYLISLRQLDIPVLIIWLAVIGALYNPFGFIVLAIKPAMANPQTLIERSRILLGFLPATIGFSGIMIWVIGSYL